MTRKQPRTPPAWMISPSPPCPTTRLRRVPFRTLLPRWVNLTEHY
jgi:hypothetical protein